MTTKQKGRRGEVRACGKVWYPTGDGVGTRVGRFEVRTWKFGSIHQCVVLVDYEASRDARGDRRVRIGFDPGRTREEAMRRGLEWARNYRAPESPDELFPTLFRRWRQLYRTRADILDQLFFTIGGGYTWLDGAIVSSSLGEEELGADAPSIDLPPDAPEFLSEGYLALPERERDLIQQAWFREGRENFPVGPVPDDGEPQEFYPVSEYSNLLAIPDDVRPDWLLVAYEAAKLLRDRQTLNPKNSPDFARGDRCAENRAYGERIARELEEKYPELLSSVG